MINIEPVNDKNLPHGFHEVYLDDGEIWYKYVFYNGKPVNYAEYYNLMGEMEKIFHI